MRQRISSLSLGKTITEYEVDLLKYKISSMTAADIALKHNISKGKVVQDAKIYQYEFTIFLHHIELVSRLFVRSVISDNGNVIYGFSATNSDDPILWYAMHIIGAEYFNAAISVFEAAAFIKLCLEKSDHDNQTEFLNIIDQWATISEEDKTQCENNIDAILTDLLDKKED